jgi:exopolysaccharide/PEP-CTERM locus tyrosine autokinase
MSIIDRATSKQRTAKQGAKPISAGAKHLAPGPGRSRKEASILDDIDAWDQEREKGRNRSRAAQTELAQPDLAAFGAAFKPAAKHNTPQSPAVKRSTKTKPQAPTARSREFAFDHQRLEKFGFITPKVRRSRISEEFRLIKRRLMQRMSLSAKTKRKNNSGERNHVILVTSARPSEGKSFVAMNLALSIIFDEGLNVMLVDSDVARPSMSKILGLRNDLPGLTDLLLDDEASLPDVLLREYEHPMTYLAAGAVVPSATDLFGGDRMEALVTDMAERYSDRIIIFDGPPLLASTEPVALAEHAGQVVMVVDAEKTSRSAVDSALDLLETDQNVNLVLNKTTVGNRTEQFGSYYEAYNQA